MMFVTLLAAVLTWAREAALALLVGDFAAYYERYAAAGPAATEEWLSATPPNWIVFPNVPRETVRYRALPDQAGQEWTLEAEDGSRLGTLTRHATENPPVRRVLFSFKNPDGRPTYAVLFRVEPAGEHHTRVSVSCRHPGTSFELLFERTKKQETLSDLCAAALENLISAAERTRRSP